MKQNESNDGARKALQTQVNEDKVVKCNFSKTPAERAELQNAKQAWRRKMKAENPEFTKRDWSHRFSQAAQK